MKGDKAKTALETADRALIKKERVAKFIHAVVSKIIPPKHCRKAKTRS